MTDTDAVRQDLLIIRRGGGAQLDTPKGGVWKIAYADFMTAMMAFFLVMWLINATSESTKTGIANYFNPIKLSDGRQLPQKGLRDPELIEPEPTDPAGQEHQAPAPASEPSQGGPQGGPQAEPSRGKIASYSEAALFRDPYAVLAAIAAGADGTAGLEAGGNDQAPGAAGERNRIGSDPFRDPFDPPARILSAPATAADAATPSKAERQAEQTPAPSGADRLAEQAHAPSGADREVKQTPVLRTAENGREPGAKFRDGPAAIGSVAIGSVAMADAVTIAAANAVADDERTLHETDPGASPDLADRLLESLAAEAAANHMPNVTVTTGDDGVLISLSDQVDFGMFAIGSAQPLPETIAVMAKIAGLLNEVPGQVIIRGHTDGRPFRSDSYDNWRLSTARAHMAYHMLVRGGLDAARVSRIEGHADRDLKVPGDPDAAENRRIEILVQGVQS